MTERFDLAIIGAGIVGLATAWQMLRLRPSLRLAVLDKEPEIASHQSGHNTGVLHAGIYYRPGSFKAKLCRDGKAEMERFAEERGIPFRRCGKVIVAIEPNEIPRLAGLLERALANGVEGIEEIGPERLREIEPHVAGLRAIHSPTTGVIEFRRVALALAGEIRDMGGAILPGRGVTAIQDRSEARVLVTSGGDVLANDIIACAGLHSDRVAALTGSAGNLRIVPFRGDYYTFRPEARRLVRALVNPVPDPALPFLGVHFSRRIDNEVLAGPNAVLAFAREGYRLRNVAPRDLIETVAWPGFRRMMRRYFATGARELWKDVFPAAYVRQLRRYLPEIERRDLLRGPSGVRAQALDRAGNLLDDFSFGASAHVLHVRNAPSPAATASLAIGRHLSEMAAQHFGLPPV